jgi:uncharacterized membrane protein YecN with MAPEG domain
VFLPLLAYLTLTSAKEDFPMVYAFGMLWIFFRVLFSIGYVGGYMIGDVEHRAIGISATFTLIPLLILKVFGVG